jgi:hypothetical protein
MPGSFKFQILRSPSKCIWDYPRKILKLSGTALKPEIKIIPTLGSILSSGLFTLHIQIRQVRNPSLPFHWRSSGELGTIFSRD